MALIKCTECGREISDKAICCPGCGCPASEFSNITSSNAPREITDNKSALSISNELLNELYDSENGKKILIIKKLHELTGHDLNIIKEKVDQYFKECFPEKQLHYTPQQDLSMSEQQSIPVTSHEFHGIYRYGILGGRTEVHCPRCGSEDCSHYQEQKIKPEKTKTRYTVNINPLRPFTLVNKKEKIIRKERVTTEKKIICNKCGYIFL